MLNAEDVKHLSDNVSHPAYVALSVDSTEALAVKNVLENLGYKSFIRTTAFGIEVVITDRVSSEDA